MRCPLICAIMLITVGCNWSPPTKPSKESWGRAIKDDQYAFQLLCRNDSNGRHRLKLNGTPSNIFAFASRPEQLEYVLRKSDWLFIAFHTNSIRDHKQVKEAIRFGIHNSEINVGIRAFSKSSDNKNWCNQCAKSEFELGMLTPIWLRITDGKIVREHYGPLTIDEIPVWFSTQE